ncbi:hypothetical protein DEJ28_05120 [Curtobacterium sp. MCPF17_002]|uniref:hypothetical protein n=1 Tax=Curtobacterium sp. MCPF17_002 TaxID=2175645 RepID=UPI000DAAC9C1|nr:hypothetical protein [Curtobacterium sp. MCPF17_002]WIB78487.1 hypothetical protein DEJ28_05120 [Curtobacterium sp. MCPF17_002]
MTNDDETTPFERTGPLDPTDLTTPLDQTTPVSTASVPPAPAPPAPAPRPRRSARFGTIFWGVVLLVFALAMAVTALPWFSVDPVTLLLAACIAAGVLLVVAGVAAVVARPRQE